jgi:hypothetical protein
MTYGDRVLDNAYLNALIRHMINAQQAANWSPGPASAKVLYENTTVGCAARRLFADFVGYIAWDDSANAIGWTTMMKGYSQEMWLDTMMAVMRYRGQDSAPNKLWMIHLAQYYEKEGLEKR